MATTTRVFTVTYIVLAASAPSLVAQDQPLVTDRPDQTESASIVFPGAVQVETGWSVARDEVASFENRHRALFQSLVRVGLSGRLEGRVGFAGLLREEVRPPSGSSFDESGAGDLDLGFKLKLVQAHGTVPDVALLGTVALPTGAEPFQRLRTDPSVRLAFANALSDRVGLGYNVGVEWNTECDPIVADACGEKTFTDAFYTVAVGFGVADRVGAFIETFGTFALNDARSTHYSVDGGFTFLVRDNLQLDASGGVGINEDATDWFTGVGVSVRLPR